jgi:hypothetical protein
VVGGGVGGVVGGVGRCCLGALCRPHS